MNKVAGNKIEAIGLAVDDDVDCEVECLSVFR